MLDRYTDYYAALKHPTRRKILASLLAEQGIACPTELGERIPGDTLQSMARHVRELAKAGLVELVDTDMRRGGIQHFYSHTEAAKLFAGLLASEIREAV